MEAKNTNPSLQPRLSGDLPQKSELFSKEKSNTIWKNGQRDKAQSKEHNAALKEASIVSCFAGTLPYEAGEDSKGRQARIQTILECVDKAGLRTGKMAINDHDGQNQGMKRPGGDESCLGHECIGTWSAHGEEQE